MSTYTSVPLSEPEKEDHVVLDQDVSVAPSTLPAMGEEKLHYDGGLCQFDWGPNNHMCYDCARLEPCCGAPANCGDGLYCVACWMFCGYCSMAKLLATSQGNKECNLVNHCLPFVIGVVTQLLLGWIGIFVNLFLISIVRCQLRGRANVGKPSYSVTDCLWTITPLVSLCSLFQMIRSVPAEGWDWLKQANEVGIPLVATAQCQQQQQQTTTAVWAPVTQAPVVVVVGKAPEQHNLQAPYGYAAPIGQPIDIHGAPVASAPFVSDGQVPQFVGAAVAAPVYQPTNSAAFGDHPTQYHM